MSRNKKNRIQKTTDRVVFDIITYGVVIIFTILCLFPFIMLISASFSDEQAILREGYGLLPKEPTTAAYKMIFDNPGSVARAYVVTIIVTASGTAAGIFLMSMAAYAMSNHQFKWRNFFSFFFFFTTLFNGGLVPWYIMITKTLGLKNNLLVLILPYLFSVFYMIILRSSMNGLPDAIPESARIDGAGEFRILFQLIIPLSLPSIATIGLFLALQYWNDWYLSMMFITDTSLYSLQYLLYRTLGSIQGLKMAIANGARVDVSAMPTETIKNAMAVVATGPILLLYPFVQKYFVKGLTIGSVKG